MANELTENGSVKVPIPHFFSLVSTALDNSAVYAAAKRQTNWPEVAYDGVFATFEVAVKSLSVALNKSSEDSNFAKHFSSVYVHIVVKDYQVSFSLDEESSSARGTVRIGFMDFLSVILNGLQHIPEFTSVQSQKDRFGMDPLAKMYTFIMRTFRMFEVLQPLSVEQLVNSNSTFQSVLSKNYLNFTNVMLSVGDTLSMEFSKAKKNDSLRMFVAAGGNAENFDT